LNVLLVHCGRWDYITGVITHVCCLGRALAARGHSVRAIMRGEQKEFVRDGVRYSLSPNLFRFILDVRRHAKACEIIHCHDTLSVLACLPVGRRVLIYTSHHVLAERQLFRSGQEWSRKTGLGLRTGLECSAASILGWAVLKSVDRSDSRLSFHEERSAPDIPRACFQD